MKKVVSLGLLSAMFLANGMANALSLQGVEHDIDLGVSYTAQIYSGDSAYDNELMDVYKVNGDTLTNLTNQISLYVGYNAVFKMNKFFNPILGAFVSGHIPLNYTMKEDNEMFKNMISNVFDLNIKLGNRFNVCKDVDVDLYYFLGINGGIAKTEMYNITASQSHSGFSTGVGVDASYKHIIFGVYYKYTDIRNAGFKFNTSNNVGIKLGYRFAL